MKLYDFSAKTMNNDTLKLEELKGKVLLIVNSATECGFTHQYEALGKLHTKYAEKGLVILDFPCNQFGGQAPGTTEEIQDFCIAKFCLPYKVMDKIEVNGENELPLYTYLKEQKGFNGFKKDHELTPILEDILSKADPDFAKKTDIKWNFTKFLVDQNGEVVARFEPVEDMQDVENAIVSLLK